MVFIAPSGYFTATVCAALERIEAISVGAPASEAADALRNSGHVLNLLNIPEEKPLQAVFRFHYQNQIDRFQFQEGDDPFTATLRDHSAGEAVQIDRYFHQVADLLLAGALLVTPGKIPWSRAAAFERMKLSLDVDERWKHLQEMLSSASAYAAVPELREGLLPVLGEVVRVIQSRAVCSVDEGIPLLVGAASIAAHCGRQAWSASIFQDAIRWTDKFGPREVPFQLQEIGGALVSASLGEHALEVIRAIWSRANDIKDPNDRALTLIEIAVAAQNVGFEDLGVTLIKKTLRATLKIKNEYDRAQMIESLASSVGSLKQAVPFLRKLLKAAYKIDDEEVRSMAVSSIAEVVKLHGLQKQLPGTEISSK